MRFEALALLGLTSTLCCGQGLRARQNTQPYGGPSSRVPVGWHATSSSSSSSTTPYASSTSSTIPYSSSKSSTLLHSSSTSPAIPYSSSKSSTLPHSSSIAPATPDSSSAASTPVNSSSIASIPSYSSQSYHYAPSGTAPKYSSSYSLSGTAPKYSSSYGLPGTATGHVSSYSLSGTAQKYTSSYGLTGTAPRHSSSYGLTGTSPPTYKPTDHRPANSSDAVCSGETLNVLGASLDWWYTRTLYNVVSTISVQFNRNDTQTGWTLLPATTPFDLSSAMASPTCSSTLTFNTDFNLSLWDVSCTPAPTPVAARTTVISQTAFSSLDSSTGVGQIPDVIRTPPPASVTIPSSGGTYSEGTAFVYFSAYEIMTKSKTQYANGSNGCAEVTNTYPMETPFSFEYTDGDVNGSKVVGAGVTGDVNPAFLGVVGLKNAKVGSWVAAPTVAVVVQDIMVAEAVLAASAKGGPKFGTLMTTETILQTPQPTLPPGFSASPGKSSGGGLGSMGFTGHIESTAASLAVPTQAPDSGQHGGGHHTNGQSPPPAQHTGGGGGKHTDKNGGRPTNNNGGRPTNDNGGNGKPTKGHKGGFGHIVSAVLSAAKPTNALQVLHHADQTFKHKSATAAAIVHGINGGGSRNGGHDNGGHNNGASGGHSNGGNNNGANGGHSNGGNNNGANGGHSNGGNNNGANGGHSNGGNNNGANGGHSNGGNNNGANGGHSNGGNNNGANGGHSNGGNNNGANGGHSNGGNNNGANGGHANGGGHGSAGSIGGVSSNNGNNGIGTGPNGTPVVVVGGTTFTANSNTQFSLGPAATLTPGGKIVVHGTTVSLASGLTAVVVNGHTHGASSPSITPAPVLTIGGTTFAATNGPTFNIGGKTLTPGGVITVDGTTVSLAPGASSVVINGHTQDVSSAMITPAPVLTIDGTTFAPTNGPTYDIGSQTLTPGGVVTFHGTTISLGPGASSVVVNGLTQNIGTATALAASITAPPVLTIGSETFSAINSGETYVINGETLTPGKEKTVTVDGTTYVVSLAPGASVLVIETEGPNGQVTATTYETLVAPGGAQSTVTNTIGVSAGPKPSAGPSQSVQASLQGGAHALTLQLGSICISLGSLALAIWL